jgi:hypothetical protein
LYRFVELARNAGLTDEMPVDSTVDENDPMYVRSLILYLHPEELRPASPADHEPVAVQEQCNPVN